MQENPEELRREIERLQAELKTTRNTALLNLTVAKDRADEIARLRASEQAWRLAALHNERLVTLSSEKKP